MPTGPKSTFWDVYPEMADLLRKRLLQGVSYGKILEEMNTNQITRNALIGKARRLGLCISRKPSAPKEPKPKAPPLPKRIFKPREYLLPEVLPTPAPYPDAKMVHLFDLDTGQCRWIMGEPADLMYCGNPFTPKTNTLSFCPFHMKLGTNKSYGGRLNYYRTFGNMDTR